MPLFLAILSLCTQFGCGPVPDGSYLTFPSGQKKAPIEEQSDWDHDAADSDYCSSRKNCHCWDYD